MTSLNVAVIGCGLWGRNHARVYEELDKASLVAVCDIDGSVASEVGRRFHVDWYDDPSELLEREDIEAVSVCTPTKTHMEVSVEVVEKGKHLLVEKPMTDTVADADELLRISERAGLYLAVGFVERFNPAVLEAKKLIERGVIGDVILAHSTRVSRRPHRIGDVGVVKDLAIHEVDIMNYLFEFSVKSVYATTGSIAHDFEDYASIVLRLKGGRDAFIEANWLTPRKVRRLILTGTEGMMTVEYQLQQVTIENHHRLYQPYFEKREPLYIELDHFVQSIIDGVPPRPTGMEGLKALKLCEAALQSSRTGLPVNIGGE